MQQQNISAMSFRYSTSCSLWSSSLSIVLPCSLLHSCTKWCYPLSADEGPPEGLSLQGCQGGSSDFREHHRWLRALVSRNVSKCMNVSRSVQLLETTVYKDFVLLISR